MATRSGEDDGSGSPFRPAETMPRPASAPLLQGHTPFYGDVPSRQPFSPQEKSSLGLSLFDNFPPGPDLATPTLSPRSLVALTYPPGQDAEAETIRCHERYPELVGRLMDCLKVGASESDMRNLDAHRRRMVEEYRGRVAEQGAGAREPGLDKVMEVTCQQLTALKRQLQQPFDDANEFCRQVEGRLAALEGGAGAATAKQAKRREKSPSLTPWKGLDSEEQAPAEALADDDAAAVAGDMDALKARMIALHGPAIARMDIDTWKKEPKARLPAAAIKIMRAWWAKHEVLPYPSENDKQRLAKRTGLDLQQVNNWFINERKRHWTKDQRAQARPAAPAPNRSAKPRGSAPKSKERSATAPHALRVVPRRHVAPEEGQMVNSTAYMQSRGLEMEAEVYNQQ